MNLALVLAHAGRRREARSSAEAALALARAQGDRRFEGAALLALAVIAHDDGDPAGAQAFARGAVEALDGVPPALPLALAVLARALLGAGRDAEALARARQAQHLLEALGRVEDGEASVRLIYAEALAATGAHAEAAATIAGAAVRLRARAAAITRPEWRDSFLTRVPDHARIIALAAPVTPSPRTARTPHASGDRR
jgi:hypothetical protein